MSDYQSQFDQHVTAANSRVADHGQELGQQLVGLHPSQIRRLFTNISKMLGQVDRKEARHPEYLAGAPRSIPERAIELIASVAPSFDSGAAHFIQNVLPSIVDLERRLVEAVGSDHLTEGAIDLLASLRGQRFGTILADPPWQFHNRTGKVAPEHKRLNRYGTMTFDEICALPVEDVAADPAHLYLWVPNALLPDGLKVMEAWGFRYISNIVWHKVRKDGGSDGRGVGFYFRNVTEILLFGVRGKNARTLPPGRSQVNLMATRKREHSRKPDEQYKIIEDCSFQPRLEMFSRGTRPGWTVWGNQADDDYKPTWDTYSYNSAMEIAAE